MFLLVTSKLMKNGDIDYKNTLVTLIKIYKKPITVKQVLDCFQLTYGYSFPFKKFACLTCMDFFRLYPALFKVSFMKSSDHNSSNLKLNLFLFF